ncbi:hypothetical protein [Defluviimonas sp. WL0075]|uniref:Amino acid permease n=1 Tax=Albidovulum sediminicola TaxID=2984331 RepID=A0ABT2Z339_9RHOB|nr:hypothetical protein [Defluviimonas sp. WL0075]MCV2865417.1 hypothetical protein [Defluviimonas sp. WL0075]
MLIDALILAAGLGTAGLLLWPRLARARLWGATVTPLASIIGSGFLVLGPVLEHSYGVYAPFVMALLCLAAYAFGGAIRFNITRRMDGKGHRSAAEERLETLASWALAFAYVISVAYYLNLFGAFAVSLTPFASALGGRIVTTAVFGVILATGWLHGFRALERMEQISVGIKLAIIAAMLAGLAFYFGGKLSDGGLVFDPPTLTGWPAVQLAFGLIVTVQGFETARYLGAEYDAPTRRQAMRIAQWLSTAIYLAYIGLIAYLFTPDEAQLSETAIIDMMRIVAPVLPGLLVAAALAAQFSAAVADTGGAGGLVSELTRGRIPTRSAYLVLVAAGLALTWAADIFAIIAYASRAFALYYAIQALIAAAGARETSRPQALAYAALAGLGAMMAIFGTSAE